jgi:hypothetical protein
MSVPIRLPFYEDEAGVTCKVYSEADALLQSGVVLTESTTPGIYTGSINFAGGTYRNVLIYSSGSTLADATWSVAVVTDAVEASYADSIGELRARATDQAEHDATQVAIAAIDVVVNVTPVNGETPATSEGTNLIAYQGGSTVIPIGTNGRDFTSMTLRFVVENSRNEDILIVEDGDITKTSTTVTVTIPASIATEATSHNWSLRDIETPEDNTYLMGGVLTIAYAADAPIGD